MEDPFGNSDFRHGSARIADTAMLEAAGALTWSPDALFAGYHEDGRILWYGGGHASIAGAAMFAPPRTGKLRDFILHNTTMGCSRHSRLIVDVKGECAYTTQTIAFDGRYGVYWNPLRLPGLPNHKIDATGHLHDDNPLIVEDIQALLPTMIPVSGAAQAKFFELSAQDFALPLALMLAEREGVFALPAFYDAVQAMIAGGERWNHEYKPFLEFSRHDYCRDFADKVKRGHENGTGGFDSICAELAKCVKGLSSPRLRESLSPPFDFSPEELCDPHQLFSLYLISSEDFIEPWNIAIRMIMMAARKAKQMNPSAPRQIWVIDEASAFKNWEIIPELYSRGAGQGIVPITVWQNTSQLLQHGQHGAREIMGGAGLRIFFAMRDEVSAQEVSRMIGYETLAFDDETEQAKSRLAHSQALMNILDGGDVLTTGIEAVHHAQASKRSSKMSRLVRQPSELLRMSDDRMWMWMAGVPAPIYARRKAYYDTPWLAGRYTGTPYYPPENHVRIVTSSGPEVRRVVIETVPSRYAHFPQYQQSGEWRYVEGFRP